MLRIRKTYHCARVRADELNLHINMLDSAPVTIEIAQGDPFACYDHDVVLSREDALDLAKTILTALDQGKGTK